MSEIKLAIARIRDWVITKNWDRGVCIVIVDWDISSGTDTASWEKKLCIIIGDWGIGAAISLVSDFVSTRKCCKDWDINTEIIKESKGKSNWDSHEKVESEAIGKPRARTSSIL